MRGLVVGTPVGLDLDDPAGHAAVSQHLVEQPRGDVERVARQRVGGDRFAEKAHSGRSVAGPNASMTSGGVAMGVSSPSVTLT